MTDETGTAQIAAAEWRRFIEPLLPIGERLVAQMHNQHDPQLRQEIYRSAFAALAGGYISVVNDDPSHPDFSMHVGHAFNLLGPNPDFTYCMTPIGESGVYKISGYRGSVRIVIVQVAGGLFVTRGDGSNFGTTHANYYLDDLTLGPDGAFEVILSPEKPAGWTGDWWHLPPHSTNIMLRQMAYDWLTEVDARVAIERLDAPAQRPRPSAEQIGGNLSQLATWAENYVKYSALYCERFAARGINDLHFIEFGDDGGMTKQAYLEGMYEMENDEAMILETELPNNCHYWSFHVLDELWASLDWFNRQTILNGHTAVLDSDGKFRAVISAVDPGVQNWLDNMSYRRALVQGRWHGGDSRPQPIVKVVKVADVMKHLPSDTKMVTPEERDASIRRQRKGAQMRRRW